MKLIEVQKDFVVVEKPVGTESEHQMVELLKAELPGAFYPVHRLDLNVGGLMVYARSAKAAAALSAQMTQGLFIKEYVALVHGTPPETGDWTDLLFKDSRKNKVFLVNKKRTGVKEARLTFHRLTAGEQSLVRIRLFTGRSHQIRSQFSGHGFPLVGDHKYGSRAKETAPMLYSCCLRFSWDGEKCYEQLPEWAAEQTQNQ